MTGDYNNAMKRRKILIFLLNQKNKDILFYDIIPQRYKRNNYNIDRL